MDQVPPAAPVERAETQPADLLVAHMVVVHAESPPGVTESFAQVPPNSLTGNHRRTKEPMTETTDQRAQPVPGFPSGSMQLPPSAWTKKAEQPAPAGLPFGSM